MLTYVDAVLRVVLNRLDVNASCISRLLHVAASLYRRTESSGPHPSVNSIAVLVLEILADGLRMKARVLPSTLRSMLEVTVADFSASEKMTSCHSL